MSPLDWTARPVVVDADGAAAADNAAIAAGIPSRALMRCAGAAAAAEMARRLPDLMDDGVLVAAGGGNNGGDGWVVAQCLHAAGIRVLVVECLEPRSPDARAEREAARAIGVPTVPDTSALADGSERVVVDALLGTGFRGDAELREPIAGALASLALRAARGATIVALDVPSGLDATTGHSRGELRAALTLTFGTVKRGQLVARERCGTIVALDIGLGAHLQASRGVPLADARWFRATLPPIAADAHKGTRGKVAIVGGATGMAGAVVLAARSALCAGAGLVKCVVAPESLPAVQEAVPEALASPWPVDDDTMRRDVAQWADAVLMGPGLGREGARAMAHRVLREFAGPVVLDADALNAYAGDADALEPHLRGRPSLLTPHPAEFARLAGGDASVEEVLANRFEWPGRLAVRTGATVLLKGVPTVIAAPRGAATVVAEGTPILATGGAGDMLGGIAVTLLAQVHDAEVAGALAAFAHGRAAFNVSARAVRGYTLEDVLRELPSVWSLQPAATRPPLIAELPAVGEPR